MTDIGKSLTQFLTETQRQQAAENPDLIALIDQIASACKQISNLVARSHLLGLNGYAETDNIQGETQKKLDIVSNQVMVDQLNWSGQLAGMVSEEVEDIIPIPTKYPKGRYLICFDPLDGSSNLDVNLSVGSIFSILRANETRKTPVLKDFLQKGTEQVCAGFAVYGPSTMLILTTGYGVQGFTLDNTLGEFILTHPEMRIPKDTTEFAINASNQRFWEPPVQRYVEECLQGAEGVRQKNFNMRWLASMVAEVFRILTRGGVFMYPLDSKNAKQGGRLRLLYEANPMSFIVEQAGGVSSTGQQRILELQPEAIHQRVPIILGSKAEVERIVEYHQQAVVS